MATRTSLRSLVSQNLTLALLLGLTGALAAAAGACGGAGEGNTEGAGASASTGAGANTGAGGDLFPTGSGGSGTNVGGGCAASSEKAELTPVSMMIMFDSSGSMNSNNKWIDSTAALRAFVQDPETAGLGVALRFFPDNTCEDPSCSFPQCSTALVDAAPLTADPAPTDTQEQAIVAAINAETPDGDHTPIYAALGGAVEWARGYMTANPGEKAVVVFVTDGAPNGCNENSNAIAAVAGDGFMNGGVYTYSVGLQGSNEALMNLIAQQGGSGQAILIGAGGNATQDLIDALKAIQGAQLSCQFQIPDTSPTGDDIDPNKVNVTYTPGSGGPPQTLGNVADAAACGPGGGWHYDNNAAPTQIILCPNTCNAVQADQAGEIALVFGCGTQAAE